MKPDLTALPARARAVIYWMATIAGLVVGSAQVAYGAMEQPLPVGWKVAAAVLGYLMVAAGITALGNLSPDPEQPAPIEQPDSNAHTPPAERAGEPYADSRDSTV